MKRLHKVDAFILAGGASSRMGRNKALLDFGGAPLILHTARLVAPLVSRVTIIGPPDCYSALGLRAIADNGDRKRAQRRRGPLAGIATALGVARLRWNLILACDLPNLSAEWLSWLLARALRSRGQIVIPETERGLEPLAAVYRRECCEPIAAALARGERKVSDVIRQLRLDVVTPRDWERVDSRESILKNMNTPRDYRAARKVRKARQGTETVK